MYNINYTYFAEIFIKQRNLLYFKVNRFLGKEMLIIAWGLLDMEEKE